MVAYMFNPTTWEAEARGFTMFEARPELNCKTLSQKARNSDNKEGPKLRI